MKILLPLFVLFFSLSVLGQKNIEQLKKEVKTFKRNKHYAVGYDKFKDLSIVSFSGAVIGGKTSFAFGGTLVTFGIDFYFKGQELKETTDPLIWKFVGYSQGVKNNFSDTTLYVLADGERFEFKEGLGSSKIGSDILGDLKTTQILSFIIRRTDLEKFANAKVLEIKIADKPFTIKPEQQQIFKDILNISDLK